MYNRKLADPEIYHVRTSSWVTSDATFPRSTWIPWDCRRFSPRFCNTFVPEKISETDNRERNEQMNERADPFHS